jgi:hypothetical protein
VLSIQFILGFGCVFQLAKHYDNYGDSKMNERIRLLADQAGIHFGRSAALDGNNIARFVTTSDMEKFAELIVAECVNREELLGAIARGWCSEKNSHKTMDSDLAVAIFDEVERQIKKQFGVEE